MAIAGKRVEFRTQTTNIATKDFTTIKSNKNINLPEANEEMKDSLDGVTEASDSSSMLDSVKDAIGGIKEAASGIKDKVSGIKDTINNVKSSINEVTKGVKDAVNQVKATVQPYVNGYKSVMKTAKAVQRFCKDPSMSSLAEIEGSLGDTLKNVPGLEGSSMGKMIGEFQGNLRTSISKIADVQNTVNEYVSEGIKCVSDVATTCVGTLQSAVKEVSGGLSQLSTIGKSVGELQNSWGAICKTATDLGVPGSITAAANSATDFLSETGITKAIASVNSTLSKASGCMNFVETAKTKLTQSYKSIFPAWADATTLGYNNKKDVYMQTKDAASTIRRLQSSIDDTITKAKDGILSTSTSKGDNESWSLTSWLTGSSNTSTTDDNGKVSKTSNETNSALAEMLKTKVDLSNTSNMTTTDQYLNNLYNANTSTSANNTTWNSFKGIGSLNTSISEVVNNTNQVCRSYDKVGYALNYKSSLL